MNGNATIATSTLSQVTFLVYKPTPPQGLNFSLGTSGNATVMDGVKGFAEDLSAPTSITFSTPVARFGSFWGASTGFGAPDPAVIQLQFFAQDNSLIASDSFSYSRPGDGILEWHGWYSDIPIKTITFTGRNPVMDFLQADPVPEPAALLALVFASVLIRGGCCCRRKKSIQ